MKRYPEEVLIPAIMQGNMNGLIEKQESAGQQDLLFNEVLPIKGILEKIRGESEDELLNVKKYLEKCGFVFGELEDELFIKCKMPKGWIKTPTHSSYWTELIDKDGNVRGKIFYKAAFYDRGAHIFITPRYRFTIDTTGGINYYTDLDLNAGGNLIATIKDKGKTIWKSAVIEVPPYAENEKDHRWKIEQLEKFGEDIINKKFPEWKNRTAYWFKKL